jgi:hypothetical protein
MKWTVAFVAVVLALSDVPGLAQGVPEGAGRIEALLGVAIDAEGVTFQVRTGGCTHPEDFQVKRFSGVPTQLLLIRTVDDRCEGLFPYGTTFKLSYGQLRVRDQETFVVVNPLAVARVVDLQ